MDELKSCTTWTIEEGIKGQSNREAIFRERRKAKLLEVRVAKLEKELKKLRGNCGEA